MIAKIYDNKWVSGCRLVINGLAQGQSLSSHVAPDASESELTRKDLTAAAVDATEPKNRAPDQKLPFSSGYGTKHLIRL